MNSNAALGLDVGGTKLAGVLMAADGTIIAQNARYTHANEGGEAVLHRLMELAETLLDRTNQKIVGIGVATPGIVDSKSGSVRFISTELPGWSELSVSKAIVERFGVQALVENDGRVAALAEHRLGVGRDCSNFITIVLGTGVGGGIIANNELVRGEYGGGGRLGHISVDPQGPVCPCGNRGCLELYASGPALANAMALTIAKDEKSVLVRSTQIQIDGELSGRKVVEAALAGDAKAREVVQHAGRKLGHAIVQLSRILDPKKIAVGGSISSADELLLKPAREYLSEHAPDRYQMLPEIVRAKFGRDASAVGAALLGWEAGKGVMADYTEDNLR